MDKLNPKDIKDESIRDLAAAICIQAAVDYKRSLTGKWGQVVARQGNKVIYQPTPGGATFLLKGRKGWHPSYTEDIQQPEVYEAFFRSAWFQELSRLYDPEAILEHLKLTKDENAHREW